MTKIAITADIHFGVPGRLEDLLWAVRVLREYCKHAQIETVIICGDLFHDRQAIAIDILTHVSRFFEETAKEYDQEWIVFPGNHDMFLRHSWDINSISALKNALTVIEGIKAIQIDNKRFIILPFIQYEHAYMRVLSKIHQNVYQEGDILLTHIGVRSAVLNTCFLLKDWSMVDFYNSPFKRIYTGHFHSKQTLHERIHYPGSLIPFKFDEGDVPHGFYVYDTQEDDHKFINIWKAGAKFFPEEKMPPQYYTITDDVIEQLDINDVHNGIVRIALQKDYTMDEKKSMKQKLMMIGAQAVRFYDITKKVQEQKIVSAAPTKDLFKAWVDQDTKGTKDLDVKLLGRLNNEIILEGDEKYVLEDAE
jgi:DNA repair exonuclease SbcCD nuclease subunit